VERKSQVSHWVVLSHWAVYDCMGYGLLGIYGLWCPNPCPLTWWTKKVMGYKGLWVTQGMGYEGVDCSVLEVAVFENVGKNFYRALMNGLESGKVVVSSISILAV
jgi:hypothetical protein